MGDTDIAEGVFFIVAGHSIAIASPDSTYAELWEECKFERARLRSGTSAEGPLPAGRGPMGRGRRGQEQPRRGRRGNATSGLFAQGLYDSPLPPKLGASSSHVEAFSWWP